MILQFVSYTIYTIRHKMRVGRLGGGGTTMNVFYRFNLLLPVFSKKKFLPQKCLLKITGRNYQVSWALYALRIYRTLTVEEWLQRTEFGDISTSMDIISDISFQNIMMIDIFYIFIFFILLFKTIIFLIFSVKTSINEFFNYYRLFRSVNMELLILTVTFLAKIKEKYFFKFYALAFETYRSLY